MNIKTKLIAIGTLLLISLGIWYFPILTLSLLVAFAGLMLFYKWYQDYIKKQKEIREAYLQIEAELEEKLQPILKEIERKKRI